MLFVLAERRTSSPMLELSRFIGVDGLSALQTGQMMIALAAPLLLVPFLAAQLARHYTSGMLPAVGLMLVAVGLFWLGVVLAAYSRQ